MKVRPLVLITGLAASLGCSAGTEVVNRVVYYHDFNFLADDVAAFRPGTCCWERETGSLRGLRFAPKAEDVAHRDGFKIETPPVGKWTLTFVVQNRAKEPSPFEVVLTYADGRVEVHPFVAERPWFVMKSLFSSHDGRLVRWNLRGKPGCDFVLDYFRIEQGVHRPYRLGDPAEWLARLPPVKDEPRRRQLPVGDRPVGNASDAADAALQGRHVAWQVRALHAEARRRRAEGCSVLLLNK